MSSSLLPPPPGVQLVDWACPLTSGPKSSIEMVIRGPAFLPGAISCLPETGSLPTPSLWSNVYINKDVASTTTYQDAPVPLPFGLSPHSPSASHRRVTFFRGQSSPHPSHRPSNQWPGPSIPQHINLRLSAWTFDPYWAHHIEPPSSCATDSCGLHSCPPHFPLCL